MRPPLKGIKRAYGLATIEFTLMVGLIITSMSIAADLYIISHLRSNMDRISHNLGSTLAVQRYISANDMDQLLNALVSGIGTYQLVIYKVNLDRSMDWLPLERGSASGLCPQLSSGATFSGALPEEDHDDDSTALFVVQLCRRSAGLTPFSALLANKVIVVTAYNRMQYADISVDKTLARELGIDDDEEDEE